MNTRELLIMKALSFKSSNFKELLEIKNILLGEKIDETNLKELKDIIKYINMLLPNEALEILINYKSNSSTNSQSSPITVSILKNIINNRKLTVKYKKVNYKKLHKLTGHRFGIERMISDYNKNRTIIFTGDRNGLIKMWDIDRNILIKSLYGHSVGGSVIDMCLSPCGKFLASIDSLGFLIIWSLRSFFICHKIDLGGEAIFCEFINSPDHSLSSENDDILVVDSEGDNIFHTVKKKVKKEIKINRRPKKEIFYRYYKPTLLKKEEKTMDIIVLKSNGVLLKFKFDENSCVLKNANDSLENESIRAICITEGGRFVCCGGNWPYLLLFDVFDQHSIIMLENFTNFSVETNIDVEIRSITASINGLKFATSYANTICIYIFNSFGSGSDGNFRERSTSKFKGFFNKIILDVNQTYGIELNSTPINTNTIAREAFVECLAFLKSDILVVSCNDGHIRLYDEDVLLGIYPGEYGHVYVHPTRNIWAIIGTRITIYGYFKSSLINKNDGFYYDEDILTIGEMMNSSNYEISEIANFYIDAPINDALFSNNGNYFIVSDDLGSITTFSIFLKDVNISQNSSMGHLTHSSMAGFDDRLIFNTIIPINQYQYFLFDSKLALGLCFSEILKYIIKKNLINTKEFKKIKNIEQSELRPLETEGLNSLRDFNFLGNDLLELIKEKISVLEIGDKNIFQDHMNKKIYSIKDFYYLLYGNFYDYDGSLVGENIYLDTIPYRNAGQNPNLFIETEDLASIHLNKLKMDTETFKEEMNNGLTMTENVDNNNTISVNEDSLSELERNVARINSLYHPGFSGNSMDSTDNDIYDDIDLETHDDQENLHLPSRRIIDDSSDEIPIIKESSNFQDFIEYSSTEQSTVDSFRQVPLLTSRRNTTRTPSQSQMNLLDQQPAYDYSSSTMSSIISTDENMTSDGLFTNSDFSSKESSITNSNTSDEPFARSIFKRSRRRIDDDSNLSAENSADY